MQNCNQQNDIFCTECECKKESRFCKNCGKETDNKVTKVLSEEVEIKPSIRGLIERGDISFSYLLFAFTVLLTTLQIILIVPIAWHLKVILMIVGSVSLFYLCIFNDWFRNRIIGIMHKARTHKEKF